MKKKYLLIAMAIIVMSCGKKEIKPAITSSEFGTMPNGQNSLIYTLVNKHGFKARITDYGAKLVSLEVPDRNGNLADVILGYETLDQYIKGDQYFGATVGRYANRIAKGKFSLDGKEYQLALNNGVNHLHGGPLGYQSLIWKSEIIEQNEYPSLKFTLKSPDGDEGYPGNLNIEVIYTWDNDNTLRIDYTATTDQTTIVNLTHHSLFNLKGAGNGNILDHVLTINANAFTPVDSTLIPTGEIRPVAGTPLDFTTPQVIGERINSDYEQIVKGKGYDHNWVINKDKEGLQLAAELYEPVSGRTMKVLTTEPGIQFYSGNFLDGSQIGKGNLPYNFREGVALETQHYPDSPNHPEFPSVVLTKGEVYKQTTEYKFFTK
ncbi:MAG: aldose epimerase family protein [Bacteroidales bacterium]